MPTSATQKKIAIKRITPSASFDRYDINLLKRLVFNLISSDYNQLSYPVLKHAENSRLENPLYEIVEGNALYWAFKIIAETDPYNGEYLMCVVIDDSFDKPLEQLDLLASLEDRF